MRARIEDALIAALRELLPEVEVASNPFGADARSLAQVRGQLAVATYVRSAPHPVDEKPYGRWWDHDWSVTCLGREYRSPRGVGRSALDLLDLVSGSLDGLRLVADDLDLEVEVLGDRLAPLDSDRYPGMMAYEILARVKGRADNEDEL